MNTISIAKDFSPRTGARFIKLGPHSGEAFRLLLVKRLTDTKEPLNVFVDGENGYFSSFLEEAFGGLVRMKKFSSEDLKRKLLIKSDKPANELYALQARQYFEEALERLEKK